MPDKRKVNLEEILYEYVYLIYGMNMAPLFATL